MTPQEINKKIADLETEILNKRIAMLEIETAFLREKLTELTKIVITLHKVDNNVQI